MGLLTWGILTYVACTFSAFHLVWLWLTVLAGSLWEKRHPASRPLPRSSPLATLSLFCLTVFLSSHLSLLFPETSNTFLIGCRSANSWTWLNGLALSVSRQMGCSCTGYFSKWKKKKKRDRGRKAVCEVEGRGREIVLIRPHKRKPSLFLWAPGDRLWTYLLKSEIRKHRWPSPRCGRWV